MCINHEVKYISIHEVSHLSLSLSAQSFHSRAPPNPKHCHLPSPPKVVGSFHLTLFQAHCHQRFSRSYMGFLVMGFQFGFAFFWVVWSVFCRFYGLMLYLWVASGLILRFLGGGRQVVIGHGGGYLFFPVYDLL